MFSLEWNEIESRGVAVCAQFNDAKKKRIYFYEKLQQKKMYIEYLVVTELWKVEMMWCVYKERKRAGDDGGVAMVVHKDKLSAYIWADINLKNV
jgi:hypothetical protein